MSHNNFNDKIEYLSWNHTKLFFIEDEGFQIHGILVIWNVRIENDMYGKELVL